MKKNKILFLGIVFLGFILSFLLYFQIQYNNFLEKSFTFKIKLKQGDNSKKIVSKLCKNKEIDCFNLKIYLYFNKYNKIIPGNYVFSGQTIEEIFKKFAKGPDYKKVEFMILPGRTKFDIANKIKLVTGGQDLIGFQNNSDIFLKLMTDKDFIKKMKNKYPILNDFGNIKSLEGFIYPDTYTFREEDMKSIFFPKLLIKTSLKNFSKKYLALKEKCIKNKACNTYKLSNYQILILASIIEKEEKNNKNRPKVADIFLKRYKNNWKLGADWTLCYGLKVTSRDCKKYVVWSKYLKDKTNKYNTRALLGLPPTPVGNPTTGSINAVMFPEKNNYWYYLHDKTGKIHFAKNAKQHSINKNLYLK